MLTNRDVMVMGGQLEVKVKGSVQFLVKFTSEMRDATSQWDHTVLSAIRQR